VGVDIDMNEVVRERRWFLVNSAAFVAAFTLAAMFVSMLLIRRLATKPLKLLAERTTGFDVGGGRRATSRRDRPAHTRR